MSEIHSLEIDTGRKMIIAGIHIGVSQINNILTKKAFFSIEHR